MVAKNEILPSNLTGAKFRSPAFPVDAVVANGLEARVELVDRLQEEGITPSRLADDAAEVVADVPVRSLKSGVGLLRYFASSAV